MRIALFDLDHTLIPFDSGMAWTRHLVARGVLDAGFEELYLEQCRRYVAGTLDIHEVHRVMVGSLARFERAEVEGWLLDFEAGLAAQLPAPARSLVQHHQAEGDLCCIVTATTRFVAERFARAFGIAELIATEPARDPQGRLTGAIEGLPCYREHKVTRVQQWLEARGESFEAFERSWFYSDSLSDLPLLERVSDPVAVRPDPLLRALAVQRGWPIDELRS